MYSYLALSKQVGNHDNSRVATRFGAELVDAINMITLLLPGTPLTYNGEEIGMEDTDVSWEQTKDTVGLNAGPEKYKQFSRDPERTPMQWSAGINAGLCDHHSKEHKRIKFKGFLSLRYLYKLT
jgi:alpha-glucosidase